MTTAWTELAKAHFAQKHQEQAFKTIETTLSEVSEACAPIQIENLKSDKPDWRTLAGHYYLHHFGCKHCIAAGKGYGERCSIGAPLWDAYIQTQKSTDN